MKARALVAWNVRRIRVDRGIPQERLAYDARIDRSYMGGIEQQSENPTVDILDRIAATLAVHVSEFSSNHPKVRRLQRPCVRVASPRASIAKRNSAPRGRGSMLAAQVADNRVPSGTRISYIISTLSCSAKNTRFANNGPEYNE